MNRRAGCIFLPGVGNASYCDEPYFETCFLVLLQWDCRGTNARMHWPHKPLLTDELLLQR